MFAWLQDVRRRYRVGQADKSFPINSSERREMRSLTGAHDTQLAMRNTEKLVSWAVHPVRSDFSGSLASSYVVIFTTTEQVQLGSALL